MSFESEHEARVIQRVRDLMLGARNEHTVEEIKRRLEKIHGVRFSKMEIGAAIAKLSKSYDLDRIDRGFPNQTQYRLRELPAKQTSLFGAAADASN
jgi:hypothetical protein